MQSVEYLPSGCLFPVVSTSTKPTQNAVDSLVACFQLSVLIQSLHKTKWIFRVCQSSVIQELIWVRPRRRSVKLTPKVSALPKLCQSRKRSVKVTFVHDDARSIQNNNVQKGDVNLPGAFHITVNGRKCYDTHETISWCTHHRNFESF